MTSPIPGTGRDQMAPGDDVPAADRLMPAADRIGPDAGPEAQGNGAPVPDDTRIVPDNDPAVANDDPIIMDQQLAVDDDRIVPGNDDAGVASPAGAAGGVRPGVVTDPPPGAGPAGGGVSPSAAWPEIQAMFVDDPRASVELAAGLTDDSVEALIGSLKERQHTLLSAWQGSGAGTEELRTALQGYRTLWRRLEDFPGQS